jgi:hypothetical protein
MGVLNLSILVSVIEPKHELSIRSECRTRPKNHFMLRITFEPKSFYQGTFLECHKIGIDLSSFLLLSSGSFIWPFRVFIVYHLLTLTLSTFSKFFSHFFFTIFFICSMKLLAPLHQLVLFVAWSHPFLFINFLVTFELLTKVFFPIHDTIGW